MPPEQIIGRRYQLLSPLGHGAMGVVYRALDRLTGQVVALKQVTTSTDHTPFASGSDGFDLNLALAQEFQVLASLRHPHIISVLDYGFDDDHQPYFTMELLENAQTLIAAGQDQPQSVQVTMLVQVLHALAYLHRRGILHRDLKPGNVLVCNGQVKVLDFGLSTTLGQETGNEGTIAYMSPEVLSSLPASEASDLYALGVVAYELFVGHHPFDLNNVTQLIDAILSSPPDLSSDKIDRRLGNVLARLLSKKPQQRYASANEVIEALGNAIDAALPLETAATRESFLQGARFVGRESEIMQLSDVLANALEGRGSGWLVAGESGVGKSRLLDELRSVALVRGALVLRGQAESEGGIPFQPWITTLRWLALLTELDDFEIGVLKALIPDISILLNREAAEPPELNPRSSQIRLLGVIDTMFRRQQRPLVVIVEDLHWAGSESITAFSQLSYIAHDLPLLLVGSFRDDEYPDLPEALPNASLLQLSRLDENAVAELSEAMLGGVGRQPEILELLRRETEGNVFFVVEVVRALAESAGQLDRIGATSLPEQVSAGGVKRIVHQRLQKVPELARPLLQAAAATGRYLDLNVLQRVEDSVDMERWLITCANAAIIDVQEDRWRFTHEKLREGLLADLPAHEMQMLHRRVAVATEIAYPDQTAQAARLAHHWSIVGDAPKEAYYAMLAGRQAVLRYVPEDAITYYQRALTLLSPDKTAWRKQIYEGLGEILILQNRLPEAKEAYGSMLDVAQGTGDRAAQARAYIGLCWVSDRQGNARATMDYAHRATEAAQAANTPAEEATALSWEAIAYYRLGNAAQTLAIGERALALSTATNAEIAIIRSRVALGTGSDLIGLFDQGIAHYKAGLDVARAMGDKVNVSNMLNNLGEAYHTAGDYDMAMTAYQEALSIAESIHFSSGKLVTMTNIAGLNIELGNYDDAERDLQRVLSLPETRNWYWLPTAYRFLGEAYLGQQHYEEAVWAAQQALQTAYAMESQELVGTAWRVLGEALSKLDAPPDDDSFSADECFAESLDIFEASTMEAERARTLRSWANYVRLSGEPVRAQAMSDEARTIFVRLNMAAEVARTDAQR